MNRFIDEKKDNWQQLEGLLSILETSGLRGMSRAEVRELGELYRRAAADLAIARAETRDPKLINYLNSLVVRAHGKIYRAEGDGLKLIKRYFTHDLPLAFRRTWRFTLAAFVIFLLFAVGAFLLAFYDPQFTAFMGHESIETAAKNDMRWWLSLNEANQIGASQILTNNIQVTFLAFALGMFLCVGTIYILIINGLHIGGVLGVSFRVDPAFGNELVNFMFAHGVVELSCIFIGAGAGMAIGYSIIDPGDLPRGKAIAKQGVESAKLVIGCAIFLFIAGIIEGFISPSNLPPFTKYLTGILTGVAMLAYLLLAGRDAQPDPASD
jgi:uncharacterized membrane protein SpoIIM required for sporulation